MTGEIVAIIGLSVLNVFWAAYVAYQQSVFYKEIRSYSEMLASRDFSEYAIGKSHIIKAEKKPKGDGNPEFKAPEVDEEAT